MNDYEPEETLIDIKHLKETLLPLILLRWSNDFYSDDAVLNDKMAVSSILQSVGLIDHKPEDCLDETGQCNEVGFKCECDCHA